jgi:hypothetical protein
MSALDIEITTLNDLRRHLSTLSDVALERLHQSLTPPPSRDQLLTAIDAERSARSQRAVAEADPDEYARSIFDPTPAEIRADWRILRAKNPKLYRRVRNQKAAELRAARHEWRILRAKNPELCQRIAKMSDAELASYESELRAQLRAEQPPAEG